jgi:hypothetical protein
MSAQHTPGPRYLVCAGANPREKMIHDAQFGHYGTSFAKVSFEYEYSHMPDYGAKMAAEYAERVALALNSHDALRAVSEEAMQFTNTIERYLRSGDGTDTDVADALYWLRATIAKATGSGA